VNAIQAREWAAAQDVLVVVRWEDPVVETLGYSVRSLYAETFWLPVIGPSSLWMMRRLSGLDGVEVPLTVLSRELGLGLGVRRHSPVTRTVCRLITFGLAAVIPWEQGDHLAVRLALPPLTRRQTTRLPEHLQARHLMAMQKAAP
jgi:hypothetical protein